MTDETPTIPRAIVCHVDDCAVMIPDTVLDKARHRRGHEHREKVDEAIRRALRSLSGRMDSLAGASKRDVAAMQESIAGIERLVQGIEVPKQLPQLEIVHQTGWDDDDEQDDEDEVGAAIDDDWDALVVPTAPNEETAEETAEDLQRHQEPHESDVVGLDEPTVKTSAFGATSRGF